MASIIIEDSKCQELPKVNKHIGVDLGLKYFLITSDGEFIENSRYLRKNESKLSKVQKL